MQVCPNCNHLNRPASKFCVKCGRPVKRKNKLVLPILIAVGLIIVVFGIGATSFESILGPTGPQYDPTMYQACDMSGYCPWYKLGTNSTDCKISAYCLKGQIDKVIDGDTLLMGKTKTIRLSLVNSPERGEPGYQEAKDFTLTVCPVDKIVAEFVVDSRQPKDKYGRSVGLVYCNDMLLNELLLTNGHAEILTDFCNKSEFGTEDWARAYGC